MHGKWIKVGPNKRLDEETGYGDKLLDFKYRQEIELRKLIDWIYLEGWVRSKACSCKCRFRSH